MAVLVTTTTAIYPYPAAAAGTNRTAEPGRLSRQHNARIPREPPYTVYHRGLEALVRAARPALASREFWPPRRVKLQGTTESLARTHTRTTEYKPRTHHAPFALRPRGFPAQCAPIAQIPAGCWHRSRSWTEWSQMDPQLCPQAISFPTPTSRNSADVAESLWKLGPRCATTRPSGSSRRNGYDP